MTLRIQLDAQGNELTPEQIASANSNTIDTGPITTISVRDTSTSRQRVTVMPETAGEQSVARLVDDAKAMHRKLHETAERLAKAKPGSVEHKQLSKQYDREFALFELQTDIVAAQAELSSASGGLEKPRSGITAEGLAELRAEAAKLKAAGKI